MEQNTLSEEQIRTVFGLKLHQLRNEKGLSLFGLAKLTGLSKSYLNEIEKGKKFPKTDKIVILAKALETTYEELVSMKVTGSMAPLSDLIKSGIIKEMPLELFGISESRLIDIVANAPEKVTSFIATLFEIAKKHDVTREKFFLATLKSYQQLNENHFPELENEALLFSKRYQLDISQKLDSNELEEILSQEFGYTIDYNELNENDYPETIRSVFIPNQKRILIAKSVSETQRVFILAKELGYAHLGLTQRPLTFSWIKFNDFEEVLNNFKASYFAGALILPEKRLKDDLKEFFSKDKWDPAEFHKMLFSYTDSAETFFQRLTNLLPTHLGIKNIIFLRLSQLDGEYPVELTKELHINRDYPSYALLNPEHYCRRWGSVKILLNPSEFYKKNGISVGLQISKNIRTNNELLILTASNKDPFQKNRNRSVCVGFDISSKKKSKIKFYADKSVKELTVGVTCERCSLTDCKERAAAPTVYNEEQKNLHIEELISKLVSTYPSE